MMKNIGIAVVITVVATILITQALYLFTKYSADPNTISFKKVQVSEQMVVLETLLFSNSVGWYAGNKNSYVDGVLTIKIYVRILPFRFPGDQHMVLTTISLPNIYPNLQEIRIDGGSRFEDKVIWMSTRH